MGLRRRVTFGFMSIVGVLILSGAVSFIELGTLSGDTDNILNTNRRHSELTHDLLQTARLHHHTFVKMTAFGDRSLDSINERALSHMEATLRTTREETLAPELIDSLIATAAVIRELNDRFMAAPKLNGHYEILKSEFPQLDSLARNFSTECYNEYQPLFERLILGIDNYAIISQAALTPEAEQLHNNAYRAVTPVFISLVVMIALVLMLYYFIIAYCIQPIVVMNRALKEYLSFKVPFCPKNKGRDETAELREKISSLIKQSKNTNKE